jgi:hypothetical protein
MRGFGRRNPTDFSGNAGGSAGRLGFDLAIGSIWGVVGPSTAVKLSAFQLGCCCWSSTPLYFAPLLVSVVCSISHLHFGTPSHDLNWNMGFQWVGFRRVLHGLEKHS